MYDDSQTPGECHACLSETPSSCNLQCPGFQGNALLRTGQDRVGGLIVEFPHQRVTLLGDPTGPLHLARLMSSWNKAEVSADGPRLLEPFDIVNGCCERRRGLNADPWYAHQDLACVGSLGGSGKDPVQVIDLCKQRIAGQKKRSHRFAQSRNLHSGSGSLNEGLALAGPDLKTERDAQTSDHIIEPQERSAHPVPMPTSHGPI